MNEEKNIGGGLRETPEDPRDFSRTAVFGAIPREELPKVDFIVSEPLKVKDQFESDKCTGFALTAVSEDQEGIELSPFYQFAKTKQVMGEYESWGADLRSACKSAVKFGSIEQREEPEDSSGDPKNFSNWNIWPVYLEKLALKHKKQSYFKVDGGHDKFDNLRAALWQHRAEKRSIFTGCTWRKGWTYAQEGIIPKEESEPAFGHAFKIYGQKYRNGEPYLMAQLSNGEQIGDRGIFYFPREVVNRDFNFSAYMFMDMPKEEAKFYIENKIQVSSPWWVKLFKRSKYYA